MIMNPKKKQEKTDMVKNKKGVTWRNMVPEFLAAVLAVAGIYLTGLLRQIPFERFLGNSVLVVMGIAVLGFHVRQCYIKRELDYNNAEHALRYWVCFLLGMFTAFACVFLPVGGWPFVAVFVLLALFGNMSSGILGASVLLLIPVLVSSASVTVWVLYFISGVFGVTLFHHLESEFQMGMPLLLTLFCLLLCETAGIILLQNERLGLEMFVIPAVNMIISGILLLGILKLFSSMVLYQYRVRYLELNDTEYPLLATCRQEKHAEYLSGIHTAYFCERIGSKLNMDVDALKCAGYYHKLRNEIEEAELWEQFPPGARMILEEYWKRGRHIERKETAVLLASDVIIGSVLQLFAKEEKKDTDFDKLIDTVFRQFSEKGVFDGCNITLRELKTMQKIFKEEKLYYDFLR